MGGNIDMGTARESIAKNIRVYRELHGMTQKDLADQLGVTKAAVNNWETGNNSPDIETLMKICRLFKTTPSAMAGMTEDESSEARRYFMAYQQAPAHVKQAVDILLRPQRVQDDQSKTDKHSKE